MMVRTPTSVLKLAGNISNLNRSVRREAAAIPMTSSRQAEISQLDDLILQAMKSCKKGSTRNKKGNPAFGQLKTLVLVREALLRNHRADESPTDEIEAELEQILKTGGTN